MKQQNGNQECGNPEKALALYTDLFRAFHDSDVVRNCRDNRYFAFDIMVAIAQFTSTVLKVLEKSAKEKHDFFQFYKDVILDENTAQFGETIVNKISENSEEISSVLN